jgi:3-hydroxyacyl-[acyl-carrier-protein] dehydratase
MGANELTIAPDHAILDCLPHRPPFRFLSSVVSLTPGRDAEGRWRVDGKEPYFAGHFPSRPIVPGVLIAESLAQLSGLIVFTTSDVNIQHSRRGTKIAAYPEPVDHPAAHLAHVDVRFRSVVSPPAELILQSRLARTFGALWQFEVQASIVGRVIANGTLVLSRTTRTGGVS